MVIIIVILIFRMDLAALILHVFLIVLAIILSLFQQSGDDGISGTASSSNHGIISAKMSSNLFSKVMFIVVTLFILNSLFLAKLHSYDSSQSNTLIAEITDDGDLNNNTDRNS